MPPQAQRELRELTHHRGHVTGRRAQRVNVRHRTLEGTNLKLSSGATDISGVSETAMLQELLAGETNPDVLAELALGTLRKKIPLLRRGLQGTVRPHQQLILSQLLTDIACLDEQFQALTVKIAQRLQAQAELLER